MRCTETKSITKRAKTVTPISDRPASRYWTMNNIWNHRIRHTLKRIPYINDSSGCKGFKFKNAFVFGKDCLKVGASWPIERKFSIIRRSSTAIPMSKLMGMIIDD